MPRFKLTWAESPDRPQSLHSRHYKTTSSCWRSSSIQQISSSASPKFCIACRILLSLLITEMKSTTEKPNARVAILNFNYEDMKCYIATYANEARLVALSTSESS